MEILAHVLWTTAGVRKVNKEMEKKKKPIKINYFWASFLGIFPDLFAFTIPFLFAFSRVIMGEQFISFDAQHRIADGFDISHILYQYSHSLVIFLLIFLIIWAIRKHPPLMLLGWALHILIDIPSHSINFYPTPFLFPISDYRFPFGIAWSNMWFMIVNYVILIIVWGSILIKNYRKPKILFK
jgi:hypothetical protein